MRLGMRASGTTINAEAIALTESTCFDKRINVRQVREPRVPFVRYQATRTIASIRRSLERVESLAAQVLFPWHLRPSSCRHVMQRTGKVRSSVLICGGMEAVVSLAGRHRRSPLVMPASSSTATCNVQGGLFADRFATSAMILFHKCLLLSRRDPSNLLCDCLLSLSSSNP